MKCPKCSFITSNRNDVCPRCTFDLRLRKKELGIRVTQPDASIQELVAQLDNPKALEELEEQPEIHAEEEAPKRAPEQPKRAPEQPKRGLLGRFFGIGKQEEEPIFEEEEPIFEEEEIEPEADDFAEETAAEEAEELPVEIPVRVAPPPPPQKNRPAVPPPTQQKSAAKPERGSGQTGTQEAPQSDFGEADVFQYLNTVHTPAEAFSESLQDSLDDARSATEQLRTPSPQSFIRSDLGKNSPSIAPKVLEFGDDMDFDGALDEMLGEDSVDVTAVAVEPERRPKLGSKAWTSEEDEFEFDFDFDEDQEESEALLEEDVFSDAPDEGQPAAETEDPFLDQLVSNLQSLEAQANQFSITDKTVRPAAAQAPQHNDSQRIEALRRAQQVMSKLGKADQGVIDELSAVLADAYGMRPETFTPPPRPEAEFEVADRNEVLERAKIRERLSKFSSPQAESGSSSDLGNLEAMLHGEMEALHAGGTNIFSVAELNQAPQPAPFKARATFPDEPAPTVTPSEEHLLSIEAELLAELSSIESEKVPLEPRQELEILEENIEFPPAQSVLAQAQFLARPPQAEQAEPKKAEAKPSPANEPVAVPGAAGLTVLSAPDNTLALFESDFDETPVAKPAAPRMSDVEKMLADELESLLGSSGSSFDESVEVPVPLSVPIPVPDLKEADALPSETFGESALLADELDALLAASEDAPLIDEPQVVDAEAPISAEDLNLEDLSQLHDKEATSLLSSEFEALLRAPQDEVVLQEVVVPLHTQPQADESAPVPNELPAAADPGAAPSAASLLSDELDALLNATDDETVFGEEMPSIEQEMLAESTSSVPPSFSEIQETGESSPEHFLSDELDALLLEMEPSPSEDLSEHPAQTAAPSPESELTDADEQQASPSPTENIDSTPIEMLAPPLQQEPLVVEESEATASSEQQSVITQDEEHPLLEEELSALFESSDSESASPAMDTGDSAVTAEAWAATSPEKPSITFDQEPASAIQNSLSASSTKLQHTPSDETAAPLLEEELSALFESPETQSESAGIPSSPQDAASLLPLAEEQDPSDPESASFLDEELPFEMETAEPANESTAIETDDAGPAVEMLADSIPEKPSAPFEQELIESLEDVVHAASAEEEKASDDNAPAELSEHEIETLGRNTEVESQSEEVDSLAPASAPAAPTESVPEKPALSFLQQLTTLFQSVTPAASPAEEKTPGEAPAAEQFENSSDNEPTKSSTVEAASPASEEAAPAAKPPMSFEADLAAIFEGAKEPATVEPAEAVDIQKPAAVLEDMPEPPLETAAPEESLQDHVISTLPTERVPVIPGDAGEGTMTDSQRLLAVELDQLIAGETEPPPPPPPTESFDQGNRSALNEMLAAAGVPLPPEGAGEAASDASESVDEFVYGSDEILDHVHESVPQESAPAETKQPEQIPAGQKIVDFAAEQELFDKMFENFEQGSPATSASGAAETDIQSDIEESSAGREEFDFSEEEELFDVDSDDETGDEVELEDEVEDLGDIDLYDEQSETPSASDLDVLDDSAGGEEEPLWADAFSELRSARKRGLFDEIEITAGEVSTLMQSATMDVLFQSANEELVDPEKRKRRVAGLAVESDRKVDARELETAVLVYQREEKVYRTKQAERRIRPTRTFAEIKLAPRKARVLAAFLDVGSVLLVSFIVSIVFIFPQAVRTSLFSFQAPSIDDLLPNLFTALHFTLIFWLISRVLTVIGYGAGPGGRFLKLEIVDYEGRALGPKQALLRACAETTLILTCGLSALTALGKTRRTLHDYLAKTLVAERKELPVQPNAPVRIVPKPKDRWRPGGSKNLTPDIKPQKGPQTKSSSPAPRPRPRT